MAPPKSKNKNSSNRKTKAKRQKFGTRIRGRKSATRTARRMREPEPADALAAAVDTDVSSVSEPLIEWDYEREEVVALDLDVPEGGSPLPADVDVEMFFADTLPQPAFAWRTHHGGLRAIFVQCPSIVGDDQEQESALACAGAWYCFAPLGPLASWPIEIKSDTRHPDAPHPDGSLCGPVFRSDPSSRLFLPAHGARSEASEADVRAWLHVHGVTHGRYAAANCPMPGCTARRKTTGNDPVVVGAWGIRCYRCARRKSWDAIIDNREPDECSPYEAARNFIHVEHQKYVLADARPNAPEELVVAAWQLCLRTVHAKALREEYQDTNKKESPIAEAVWAASNRDINLARGLGRWLQSDTLESRTISARSAGALPWAWNAIRVDEALDSRPLRGFKPITVVPAQRVLPPNHQFELDAVAVRKRPRRGEPGPVDVGTKPSESEVEAAWQRVEQRLPGVHRGYISGLAFLSLVAQQEDGPPPVVVATGDTGSGKNAGQSIAGAMVGAPAIGVPLRDGKEMRRDMGLALEDGAGLLFIDEVARAPSPYQYLGPILALGSEVRFEAKYSNERSVRLQAPVSLLGSTLPAAVQHSPELSRRTVGWRLVGKRQWYQVGDLSRLREDEQLRGALDTITADLWWLLRELGPQPDWRDVCFELFDAVRLEGLDLDDQDAAGQAAVIRELYEHFRSAPETEMYSGKRYPGWLDASPGQAASPLLAELVDIYEKNPRAQSAQMHDLERVPMKEVLGFGTPSLKLKIHRRSARYIIKFVQQDIRRGEELPRSELPPARDPVTHESHDESHAVTLRNQEFRTKRTCRTDKVPRESSSQSSEKGRAPEPCGTCVARMDRSSSLCDTACETACAAGCVLDRVVFLDFETRSAANLKQLGGRAYAADPTTEVVCLAARLPGGSWIHWKAGQSPPAALREAAQRYGVAAHNWANFDKFIWQRLGWPAPAVGLDTLKLARIKGLPGDLDEIGRALFGLGKDTEGKDHTLALSKVDPKTGALSPLTDADVDRSLDYCRRDVEVMAALVHHTGWASESEEQIQAVDEVINDRGFQLDVPLARNIIETGHLLAQSAQQGLPVDAATLRSPAKLTAWLLEQGVEVEDVTRETLEPLAQDTGIGEEVRRVIRARLAAVRVTSPKLTAGLRVAGADSRVRDTFVYAGAHTGRWSGRDMQPHNLPRGKNIDIDRAVDAVNAKDLGALAALAQSEQVDPEDVLSTLVRSCIVAPEGKWLAAADYSAIEARGLLWVAGDEDGLDVFRRGDDLYKATASKILGVPVDQIDKDQRQLGKAAELGCGFQMGPERFREHGEGFGIDWDSAPVSPADIVEGWRDAHPVIAGRRTGDMFEGRPVREEGFWKRLQEAYEVAARFTGNFEVGRVGVRKVASDVHLVLPSGRPLIYRNASVQPDEEDEEYRDVLTYEDGSRTVKTYGGKLTENVVQAVCRDLMAEALLRLERAGLPVVLHVHDEIVCEVDDEDDLHAVEELMAEVPSWAEGLPVSVEGFLTTRYRK